MSDFACTTCHAPLAPEQRYCLQCGARRGTPRVAEADWLAAAGVPAAAPADVATVGADATAATADGPQPERPRRRPSRVLSTALAVVALTGGVVLGVALGPGPGSSDAASSSPVLLVDRAAVPPPTTTTAAAADTATDDTVNAAVDDTVVPDAAPVTPVTDTGITGATTGTTTDDTTDDAGDSEDLGDDVGDGDTDLGSLASGDPAQPKVTNVWVISLTGQDRAAWFGTASTATTLRSLAEEGTFLSAFTPVSTSPAASGIALLSGQGPNAATQAGCTTYADVTPPTVDAKTGLASGTGCVYPTAVKTLPGELTAAKKTWKAYVQSQGTPCRHPGLGALDPWPGTAADPYRTARNPFVYTREILDSPTCATNVVDLGALAGDLADAKKTPTVSWIVPDAAHDGSGANGVAGADAFLADIVPQITSTPAYQAGGLIVIAPDAPAPSTAVPAPTTVAPTGALVLSPFARAGATSTTAYDQYGLLRSIANLFDLDDLGHAADAAAKPFADDVYTKVTTDTEGETDTF